MRFPNSCSHTALVIFQLQQQLKDLADKHAKCQNQVKNLTLELCLTNFKAGCDKTGACPSGYEWSFEKPDICYKSPTDKKNIADARSDCNQTAGGRLAMPKDQVTNDFLVKKVKARYPNQQVWIGLHVVYLSHPGRAHEQGPMYPVYSRPQWKWDDGTVPGTSWDNWGSWNNAPQSECAAWMPDLSYNSDEKSACTNRLHYVCEVKAQVAPLTCPSAGYELPLVELLGGRS
ncbi:Hypp2268 [Branchiostoma lanceolatum]|uniref:Hypp2268 protein n=1 Tax=Branchiostoma lanceolatum TaxID=7740 RepID=A0A8J9ZSB2_BRALA|nr:Hypp2268 [Branchiostoma lanceolatum]